MTSKKLKLFYVCSIHPHHIQLWLEALKLFFKHIWPSCWYVIDVTAETLRYHLYSWHWFVKQYYILVHDISAAVVCLGRSRTRQHCTLVEMKTEWVLLIQTWTRDLTFMLFLDLLKPGLLMTAAVLHGFIKTASCFPSSVAKSVVLECKSIGPQLPGGSI